MRVWKVTELYCSDEELEYWLNRYEAEGKSVNEIVCTKQHTYKVIYTIENDTEE